MGFQLNPILRRSTYVDLTTSELEMNPSINNNQNKLSIESISISLKLINL